MLLINLIAARRAERRKLELVRGVLVRSMFGVGAAAALGVAMMSYSIQTTRNRIHDVDEQTSMLQDTVSQVERLQGAMTSLQPQVTTLLTAQNATNRWRAVLQEVGSSLPPKAWLTSFTSQASTAAASAQAGPGSGDGFVVTGQTVSQALVGSAMLNMNTKPFIKGVDLHYVQSNQQGGVVNFEMAGTINPVEGTTNGK